MPEKVLMEFTIEHDRESDGRRIADIPALPGTMAYGSTAEQARTQALALRVVAERLEHDKAGAESMTISFRAA